jgi:uncharacterized C2H2 Zn-finger protein
MNDQRQAILPVNTPGYQYNDDSTHETAGLVNTNQNNIPTDSNLRTDGDQVENLNGEDDEIFGHVPPNGEELEDELLDEEDDLGEFDDDEDDDDDGEDEDEDIGLDQSDFNGEYDPLDDQSSGQRRTQAGLRSGRFNNESGLSSNMLLMFKCRVCGKAFKHRRSLNRHVKLHSGEKNFRCPYCTTAFARSDHLKSHIRTHNNSKPYRCAVCQCGYSTQAALKVHTAHHHTRSKFKCLLCKDDADFHSQLALEGHMYTRHSKENRERHDMTDLINETNTVHPVLMSAEEAAAATSNNLTQEQTANRQMNGTSNLHQQQQRSRIHDVNADSENGHVKQDGSGFNSEILRDRGGSSGQLMHTG